MLENNTKGIKLYKERKINYFQLNLNGSCSDTASCTLIKINMTDTSKYCLLALIIEESKNFFWRSPAKCEFCFFQERHIN